MTAPIGFLGLSHLGIISSAGWASFGGRVIGVHPDGMLVDRLNRGDLPVHEPGLPELIEGSRPSLSYSADLRSLTQCPLVFVTLDVPTDGDNTSQLAAVEELIDQALPHLAEGATLVLMSQVPPGFTRGLGERIRRERPEFAFQLFYLVETLIFGDAVRRCLEPERFIIGCGDSSAEMPAILLEGLRQFGCPILPMRYESAELTKTAINLYLIGSVTYANVLSDLCESIGADWSEMLPALRLDKRIGQSAYIRPGLGVAGGNLERDLVTLRHLSATHQVDTTYFDTLLSLNTERLQWALRKLDQFVFREEVRPNLALWGLTYKKDTRSTRNSPALRLIAELHARAELRAWDPAIGPGDIDVPARILSDRDAVLDGADGLLIMADWDEFAQADLDRIRTAMRRPVIIDCAGVLQARISQMQGIEYVSMGR